MPCWFVFSGDNLLLKKAPDGTFAIPCQKEPPTGLTPHGHIFNVTPNADEQQIRAYETEKTDIDCSQYTFCGLRKSYYKIPKAHYLMAGKCRELLYWDANTRHCGACGAPMRFKTAISKECPSCGKEVWPQLSTAVIVLISRGDEVLLVHAHNFKGNFYGLISGFVETGETLEEAVAREVKEETGLNIRNIRYYASQPWPYPCGLMVGFYAEYESGVLRLQQSELQSGNWYRKDALPEIPEKLSIARRLIDHWLETSR